MTTTKGHTSKIWGTLTLKQSYCSCRDTVTNANKKKVIMANTAVTIIVILSQEVESSIMIFTIHQTMNGIITPGVAHQPRTQNFLILLPHKNSTSSTILFQPDDDINTVNLKGMRLNMNTSTDGRRGLQ